MRITAICLVSVVLLASVGCARAPAELEDSTAGSASDVSGRSTALSPTIPGYTHTLAKSLFTPGETADSRSENGFEKAVGAFGVFAVDLVNKSVTASRSATGVPVPYRGTGEQHNQAVRGYFISGGMPEAQIQNVTVHTAIEGTGDTMDAVSGKQAVPRFVSFSSNIGRAIAGFPVAESIAWAELDGDGRIVAETVYWPDVPGSALDEANRYRTSLRMLRNLRRSRLGYRATSGRARS